MTLLECGLALAYVMAAAGTLSFFGAGSVSGRVLEAFLPEAGFSACTKSHAELVLGEQLEDEQALGASAGSRMDLRQSTFLFCMS